MEAAVILLISTKMKITSKLFTKKHSHYITKQHLWTFHRHRNFLQNLLAIGGVGFLGLLDECPENDAPAARSVDKRVLVLPLLLDGPRAMHLVQRRKARGRCVEAPYLQDITELLRRSKHTRQFSGMTKKK